MSQESVRESTAKQRRIDDLPKKDLIKLSQDNAGHSVLNEHRLLGNIKNVAKKEQLVDTISSCLSAKGFQATEMVEEVTRVHPSLPNECDKTNFPKKSYTKLWVHPSLPNECDKTNFPKKSDTELWVYGDVGRWHSL
ncbi:peptidyl-prolyl cis-trans isomerase FKBP3-like isoform X2 [Stigmatopora argus]